MEKKRKNPGPTEWVTVYKRRNVGPSEMNVMLLTSATQPKPPQGLKAGKTNF